MSPFLAAAFVLVLRCFQDDTELGRSLAFGFESLELCEARLAELLVSGADKRLRFEGECVPPEEVERALREQRTFNDVWEK